MKEPVPAPPVVRETYHAFAAAFHVSREVTLLGYVSRSPGRLPGGGISTFWRVCDKQTGRTFLVEPWMIGALEPNIPAE